MLAHGDLPLLLRLFSRLRGHRIFVHIDAKSRHFPVEQLAGLDDVTLIEPRVAIHWADFSMVQATLSMLRAALDRDERFSKYVLISGGCYPVKPTFELASLFENDAGHNYIRLTAITPSSHLQNLVSRHWRMAPLLPDGLLERRPRLRAVEQEARAVLNKLRALRRRDFQGEIGAPPYFGSSWWALSQPCARYVVDYVRDHPAFIHAWRSTYATDELFYHTIIAQSPFAATTDGIVPDEGARTNQAAPLHLIHPSEKRIFRGSEADFELARTTDKYFIRKVESGASGGLLDRIDRELLELGKD